MRCLYLDGPDQVVRPVSIAPGQQLGVSETPIIHALNALNIDRADLVGSSLGCYMGLRTTVRHSYRVGEFVRGSLRGTRSMDREGTRG